MGEIQLQDKRVLYYTDTNEILFNDTSLKSNCIVCWEMDDPAGSSYIYPSIGSIIGEKAVIPGSLYYSGYAGLINTAWYIISGYLTFGNNFNFGTNQDFTISIWFQGISENKHLWNKRAASSPNKGIWTYFTRWIGTDSTGEDIASSLVFCIDCGDNIYSICTGAGSYIAYIDSNLWTLLVCFRRGTTIGVSLNGATPRTYTNENISDDISNTNPFYIGTNRLTSTDYTTLLDQTTVWNKALTDSQISDLYNSRNGFYSGNW